MFFFVDESGNSGMNLFDPQQPVLSYGVLSSELNPDALGHALHARMLERTGGSALHAAALKQAGLEPLVPELLAMQRRFNVRFDYYFVDKWAYAVTMLFDAVFDAGLNPAVPWHWYWTPLRFPVIATLAEIVDEPMLRESWELR